MTKTGKVIFAWVFWVLISNASPLWGTPLLSPADEQSSYQSIVDLLEAKQYHLALRSAEAFLKDFPTSPQLAEVFFISAECLHALGRATHAQHRYSAFLSRFPNSSRTSHVLFRLGEIAYEQREFTTAASYFKSLLDEHAESPLAGEAAYWLAETKLKLHEPEEAGKFFELCYQFYPSNRFVPLAMYSAGWLRRNAGDLERAIEIFEQLAARFPESELLPAVHVRIGECLFRLKEYARAIAYLEQNRVGLLKSESERAECLYLLGESYYRMQDYLNALLTFGAFLEQHATHALAREVRYTLAWSYMQERNYEKAESLFTTLQGGGDAIAQSAVFQTGMAQKLAGKLEQALTTFTTCSQGESEYADNALYELGSLQYLQKRYDDARASFRAIVERYPTSDVLAATFRMLGESLLALGSYHEALDAFHHAQAIADAPIGVVTDAQYQEAWTLLKLQRYAEAAEVFARFMQQRPNDPRVEEAHYWMAESHFLADQYERSAEDFAAFLQAYPKSDRRANALYGLGWSKWKVHDYAAAASAFQRVPLRQVLDKTMLLDVNVHLGECFFALANVPAAAQAYRAALRQASEQRAAEYCLYRLAQCAQHIETPSEAIAQYLDFLAEFPYSDFADDAMFDIGTILFRHEDYRSAVRQFQSLVRHFPQSDFVPRAHVLMGNAYHALRNTTRATQSYELVLKQFPARPEVVDAMRGLQQSLAFAGKVNAAVHAVDVFLTRHPDCPYADRLFLARADFLSERKDYEQAAGAYQSVVDRYPSGEAAKEALFGLGDMLHSLGRLEEAVHAYVRLADTFPDHVLAPDALLQTAKIQREQEQYGEALETIRHLVQQYPHTSAYPYARYEKGLVHLAMGALDSAASAFSVLLDSSSEADLAARALIGFGRVKQQEQAYDEAMQYFTRAVERDAAGVAAEAHYRIGETYVLQRRYREALTPLQRVRTLAPPGEVIVARSLLMMGECYEKLSDKAKARQAYRTVVRLHQSDELGREAEQRLKGLEGA